MTRIIHAPTGRTMGFHLGRLSIVRTPHFTVGLQRNWPHAKAPIIKWSLRLGWFAVRRPTARATELGMA